MIDINPGKMTLLRAWLDDTEYEYRAYDDYISTGEAIITIEHRDLSAQEVMVAFDKEIYDDRKEEKEFVPGWQEINPEDDEEDEPPKPTLTGSQYIIINLADPDCFDTLSRIIEEGEEADVPWKWDRDV